MPYNPADPKTNRPGSASLGKVKPLPGTTHLAADYVVGGRWWWWWSLAPAETSDPTMTAHQAGWLTRHLEALGASNPDGISRTVRAAGCHQCHRPVLAGLDSHRAGLPTRCDPAPLTAAGEALAALLNVTTFRIRRYRDGYALTRRCARHIAADDADHATVLAEHRCGLAIPAHLHQPAPPARPAQPDEAPF